MIRIGTSGWSYDHWVGVLYPERTAVSARLARYADEFTTVELNASFYRWPKESTFAGWRQRLPDGFTMSVKAHRGLTHFRRLKSPEPWVERFERCWRALGDRSEMLLVQLHPEQQRDDGRLDYFLSCMPDWIRMAVELRHPSWDDPVVYALLEQHRAVAEPFHRGGVVRDEDDRAAALLELEDLAEALALERLVADREHLVEQEDARFHVRGDREAETHVHPRRVRAHGQVDRVLEAREGDDLVEALADRRP